MDTCIFTNIDIIVLDSQKQLSALNLLVGYLRLLGSDSLESILQSRDHLDRFINCLMLVSQMERSGITLLEEYAIRGQCFVLIRYFFIILQTFLDFESISGTPITWKHFKFIGEAELFNKFQNALHLSSASNAATVIIDTLCSLFEYEYENRNEIIFLLNEIISGEFNDASRLRINFIGFIISESTQNGTSV